jgi:hypothetical protein
MMCRTDHPVCWDIGDQYLFEPDYVVAPVLTPGARHRTVYLPAVADWHEVKHALARLQSSKIKDGRSLLFPLKLVATAIIGAISACQRRLTGSFASSTTARSKPSGIPPRASTAAKCMRGKRECGLRVTWVDTFLLDTARAQP